MFFSKIAKKLTFAVLFDLSNVLDTEDHLFFYGLHPPLAVE